jgi:hypothetical protein
MHAARCPFPISPVACSTPTTAGKSSRAITAPWVIRPPTAVTRPVIVTNRGDQLGSVLAVTQDVARFETGLRHVMNDTGPGLDDPGGNR